MKISSALILVAAVLSGGCAPKKSKVCDGCLGSDLKECELAYESCDSMDHCRYSDIKQEFADDICVGD